MTYKGGTPTAESCIEQLKDLEALVDIYSKEWLAANPWGPCLGLNKCAEIFPDPTHNVSVEPTLQHQGLKSIVCNYQEA